MTTRQGGDSRPPYDSFNLALHVGDDPQGVEANRTRLCQQQGVSVGPQWLEQVHGIKVVEAQADGLVRTADACTSGERGLACVVMTADCLPILLCDRAGTRVAAVHAGWRSLAGGIVRETVARFQAGSQLPSSAHAPAPADAQARADAPAGELLAYLGPAISQSHFEVGIDVLEAFFDSALSAAHGEAISAAFRPSISQPMKFHADLYQLARAELAELGVEQVFGGQHCTFADSERFYSYRRDGQTGRMAAMIWLAQGG
ncbi:multi-copper polyphenol oxidoreductase [Aestuariicella hydrocarbonica]|uniref:Multi-copper polyphenol oxidoreductase n=2 Tax=Pseudomaricurvus hydrocarbonicus TaxID=1470433 RepID=A0A9E5T477_9GAMM|nr:polyphenol oxidase family protein [Aestuariicella hydrocarbonica]NHO67742.1 multi-copper polyphenol oxidoreductase [Aestuariicella hydrocarbonica]